MHKCPNCGVVLPSGETCQERFERCLVKDYEHPTTYGAVHHLVVACYMLQHNEYSREGWLATRNMVDQAIHAGIDPQSLRKQNRWKLDSGHRQWKIIGGAKITEVKQIVWTKTIADMRLDSADIYCEDAKRWAISLLADTESMIQNLENKP